MNSTVIRNVKIINENSITECDLLIKDKYIEKIGGNINTLPASEEIDAGGRYLIPGIIDDQVHFREPGLTHKACIESESRAAAAGGVTSYMEMPNTKPGATTLDLLELKYDIAAERSYTNYSFYMGTTNSNAEEVMKVDPQKICGIKIFMGSSTGSMLVDDEKALSGIFANSPCIVAIHSEDDSIIRNNMDSFIKKYGDDIPFSAHPDIRNTEACYESTMHALNLAEKHNTKLHILHISTEEETKLLRDYKSEKRKNVSAEICVHHLFFDNSDYERLGALIKCNPAIKEARHKNALLASLLDNTVDVIGSDHAPHTWDEKSSTYLKAPSGLPLVQHSLNIMLGFYHEGKISLEKIVDKMCHSPAELFEIDRRGYIREGYYADLVLVDLNRAWQVDKSNILYKCAWSPLENHLFNGKVTHTFVSGALVYQNGKFNNSPAGMRLMFKR